MAWITQDLLGGTVSVGWMTGWTQKGVKQMVKQPGGKWTVNRSPAPRVLVVSGSFHGLPAARYVEEKTGDWPTYI